MPASRENDIKEAILFTLHYFNTFQHPLTEEELYRFLNVSVSKEELVTVLRQMADKAELVSGHGFYALPGAEKVIFEERIRKNQLAEQLIPRAKKIARFLSWFPFVRFVGLSGSLSKNVADENSDFDFFIVTDPGRLWIARSWMHFYKKTTFLTNRQHYYCMNYYVDAEHLCIEDKNRFTAIETATLKPVVGAGIYEGIQKENAWLKEFLPNWEYAEKESVVENRSLLKRIPENVLNLLFPAAWNTFFMRLTDTKWKAKWKKAGYPDEDYDLAFRTRLYVSKNHPRNFQKMMLRKEKEIQTASHEQP